MKLYVASSWKNQRYESVVLTLKEAGGFEVYDFRNPGPGDHGFAWSEIDPAYALWSPPQYAEALGHPAAVRGFEFDMAALEACDALVLVLPCGKSAHLEAGWAVGAGRPVFVLLEPDVRPEPELMYKMTAWIGWHLEALVDALRVLHG